MTKKNRSFLLGLTLAASLTGFSILRDAGTMAVKAEEAAAGEEAEQTEEASPKEAGDEEADGALDPITPSDYLIADAADYVTLGDYDGIEVVQYTFEVTDEMVQDEVQYELEGAAEEIDTGAPSAMGDMVYVTLSYQIEGSEADAEEEDTFFTLGEEDYGAEFDQKLTGVSTGDHLEFSISFDDTIWMEEWENQTVDFTADVTNVTRMDLPEYDEDFLESFTDFSTKEEYESAIRETLEESYTEQSYYSAIENLLNACVEATTFSGYPQELYDECREETLSFYQMFVGEETTLDDVLEMFGITEEEIDEETIATVNRRLMISAYCQANDLTVSEDEYVTYVTENAAYYGLESPAAFEEEYGRSALVSDLYEAKATDQLYASANILETPYDFSDDGYEEEDGDYIEDGEVLDLDAEEE